MSYWSQEIGNVGHNAIVQQGNNLSVGLDEEKLVAVLEERGHFEAAELSRLQRGVIIRLARNLKRDVSDFDQAVVELEYAVEVALDVIARGDRGTNEDAFVNTMLAQVAEKVRSEDFDGGVSAIDEALAELEAKHRRSQVALLEEGMKVDTLRRDSSAVARRVAMIVSTEHATGRPEWHPDFRARFDKFWDDGIRKGINFSLSVAIELARRKSATARNVNERGVALNLLGNSLRALGERQSETACLEEAVRVLGEALKVWGRNRMPLEWAMTQHNLGTALNVLGIRENGAANLGKAVAAYKESLKERTRHRVPHDWAHTQSNLADSLRALGERESGTARLQEAAEALRAALDVWTRERVPLDWATVQNNLGTVLRTLAERDGSVAYLQEAIVAFRAALDVWTRDGEPLWWATAQNNLGSALLMLGMRESGTACLRQAVAAFHEALKQRTRDRVPLDWATTQQNLSGALMALGMRESGTARLREAIAALEGALQEYKRGRVPLRWAIAQTNLGTALSMLGQREGGTARLQEAVAAYEAALEVFSADGAPGYIDGCRNMLNQVRAILHERQR